MDSKAINTTEEMEEFPYYRFVSKVCENYGYRLKNMYRIYDDREGFYPVLEVFQNDKYVPSLSIFWQRNAEKFEVQINTSGNGAFITSNYKSYLNQLDKGYQMAMFITNLDINEFPIMIK